VHFLLQSKNTCIPDLTPKAKKAKIFALDDLRPAASRPASGRQSAAARPPAGRRPRHKAKKQKKQAECIFCFSPQSKQKQTGCTFSALKQKSKKKKHARSVLFALDDLRPAAGSRPASSRQPAGRQPPLGHWRPLNAKNKQSTLFALKQKRKRSIQSTLFCVSLT